MPIRRIHKPPVASVGETQERLVAIACPVAVPCASAPVPLARCGVACLRRMKDTDLTILGEHYGHGRVASRVFGITRADRRQGLHLIGQSGTGKSALMLSML